MKNANNEGVNEVVRCWRGNARNDLHITSFTGRIYDRKFGLTSDKTAAACSPESFWEAREVLGRQTIHPIAVTGETSFQYLKVPLEPSLNFVTGDISHIHLQFGDFPLFGGIHPVFLRRLSWVPTRNCTLVSTASFWENFQIGNSSGKKKHAASRPAAMRNRRSFNHDISMIIPVLAVLLLSEQCKTRYWWSATWLDKTLKESFKKTNWSQFSLIKSYVKSSPNFRRNHNSVIRSQVTRVWAGKQNKKTPRLACVIWIV